jgi:hypothetical protein
MEMIHPGATNIKNEKPEDAKRHRGGVIVISRDQIGLEGRSRLKRKGGRGRGNGKIDCPAIGAIKGVRGEGMGDRMCTVRMDRVGRGRDWDCWAVSCMSICR